MPTVIWWLVSAFGSVDRLFLPSPGDVVSQAIVLSGNGRLWGDIGWSVYRVFVGFALAAIVAIPIGILMGTFHAADAIFKPSTDFIRYMPAAAFIPLIMLYVGIGETAKILMIFIGTYFQLVLLVAAVARSVPMDVVNVAYTLGASQRQVLRHVVVPASLPGLVGVFSGLPWAGRGLTSSSLNSSRRSRGWVSALWKHSASSRPKPSSSTSSLLVCSAWHRIKSCDGSPQRPCRGPRHSTHERRDRYTALCDDRISKAFGSRRIASVCSKGKNRRGPEPCQLRRFERRVLLHHWSFRMWEVDASQYRGWAKTMPPAVRSLSTGYVVRTQGPIAAWFFKVTRFSLG